MLPPSLSPVPIYTMSSPAVGITAIALTPRVGLSSVKGVHVTPLLVDFHKPPEAAPAYNVLPFSYKQFNLPNPAYPPDDELGPRLTQFPSPLLLPPPSISYTSDGLMSGKEPVTGSTLLSQKYSQRLNCFQYGAFCFLPF